MKDKKIKTITLKARQMGMSITFYLQWIKYSLGEGWITKEQYDECISKYLNMIGITSNLHMQPIERHGG